jgi:tetratricopeptide (TPR) repeat protein
VNRWSNRFVSLSALVLLAACQSTPRAEAPDAAPSESTAAESHPAGAAAGSGAAPAAAAPSAPGTAPAKAAAAGAPVILGAPANDAPIPERAAQQYADALKLMRGGRTGDAELDFKQLAAAYPQFAGPEANLGLIYLQSSRLTDAEAAFKSALDRNPANAMAANELGIVQRKMGKFTEAESAYQRSIASAPDYAPAYLNLGVLYDLYLSQPQKALDQFEHYLQLAGENKQVSGWVVELRKRVGAGAPPAAKKDSA